MQQDRFITVGEYYKNHEEQYRAVEERLEKVNDKFRHSDRKTQRRMLLDSYIFAVFSIQTPLQVHERAYSNYTHGDSLEDAIQEVNYCNNKLSYIRTTETKFEAIDKVINHLLEDETDKAHKLMVDEFKGVGMAKAGFTMAMLGYTDKMCVDVNVQKMAGLEEVYSGVVVEKYELMTNKILEQFSELKEGVEPFIAQWVLFDFNREEHSKHKVFFNQMEAI